MPVKKHHFDHGFPEPFGHESFFVMIDRIDDLYQRRLFDGFFLRFGNLVLGMSSSSSSG
nr:hypothetical protein [Methylomarinum sp. Ch1-1]MDP4521416.1 hypothetical protein [Methylomarinum sp. Ch1-1]